MDGFELAAAAAVVLAGATVQGALGFGLGIVALPVLGLLIPEHMPQVLLVLSSVVVGWVALRERDRILFRPVGWVLGARLAGTLPGIWLVTVLATRQLQVLFGVVTLLATVLLARRFVALPLTPRSSVLAGTISGTMATAAGIGGPPLVMLFSNQEETQFRASVAAVLCVGNLASITGLLLAGRFSAADLQIAGALLPPLLVGMGCSRCLIGRLSPSRLRRIVLITCSVAAVSLLAEAAGGRPT